MTDALTGNSPESLQLTTRGGVRVDVDYDALLSIDFSAGNMRFLADLEPIHQSSSSLLDLGVDLSAEEQLFGMRPTPPQNLPGRLLGPGLEFFGSGQASFRVPDGFSKLMGAVELKPPGSKFTPCLVQIDVDGKIVWEEKLSQPRQPTEFDITVAGDQRLTLIVRATSPLPTGDVVRWQEPRLLK